MCILNNKILIFVLSIYNNAIWCDTRCCNCSCCKNKKTIDKNVEKNLSNIKLKHDNNLKINGKLHKLENKKIQKKRQTEKKNNNGTKYINTPIGKKNNKKKNLNNKKNVDGNYLNENEKNSLAILKDNKKKEEEQKKIDEEKKNLKKEIEDLKKKYGEITGVEDFEYIKNLDIINIEELKNIKINLTKKTNELSNLINNAKTYSQTCSSIIDKPKICNEDYERYIKQNKDLHPFKLADFAYELDKCNLKTKTKTESPNNFIIFFKKKQNQFEKINLLLKEISQYHDIVTEKYDTYKKKLEEEKKNIINNKLNEIYQQPYKNKKYNKNTATNIDKIEYAKTKLYTVPFFSGYHNVNSVIIPFALELNKDYINIFPKEMVKTLIEEGYLKIKENNEFDISHFKKFQIFFCYQYLLQRSSDINETIHYDILFRPHYFIAEEEIKNNKKGWGRGCIYNSTSKGSKCIIYNDKNKQMINKTEMNFSIHDNKLSWKTPIVFKLEEKEDEIKEDKIKKEEEEEEEKKEKYVLYSFVCENSKNIAAMTIHFLKIPENKNSLKYINIDSKNTIKEAIDLSQELKDDDVNNFLNSITNGNE